MLPLPEDGAALKRNFREFEAQEAARSFRVQKKNCRSFQELSIDIKKIQNQSTGSGKLSVHGIFTFLI